MYLHLLLLFSYSALELQVCSLKLHTCSIPFYLLLHLFGRNHTGE